MTLYDNDDDFYCQEHNQLMKRRVGADGDDVSYYCEKCEEFIKKLEESTWSCPVCGCNSNDKITDGACWHCGWDREEDNSDVIFEEKKMCRSCGRTGTILSDEGLCYNCDTPEPNIGLDW